MVLKISTFKSERISTFSNYFSTQTSKTIYYDILKPVPFHQPNSPFHPYNSSIYSPIHHLPTHSSCQPPIHSPTPTHSPTHISHACESLTTQERRGILRTNSKWRARVNYLFPVHTRTDFHTCAVVSSFECPCLYSSMPVCLYFYVRVCLFTFEAMYVLTLCLCIYVCVEVRAFVGVNVFVCAFHFCRSIYQHDGRMEWKKKKERFK